MFDPTPIDEALTRAGYKRRKRLVYQAQWSTPEVEHFITFSLHGRPKELVTARFGLRNPRAEMFSAKCIRTYGGDLFKILRSREDIGTNCTMSFSFSRLIPRVRRWSLNVSDLSNSMLRTTIESFIANSVLPVVAGVRGLDEFFCFLIADAEPCPWVASNGAIRAAQIVAVGRQIGRTAEQIRVTLGPFKSCIFRGLSKTSGRNPDTDSYLDKVFADWEVTSRES
jgi:hypothetical protein